MKKIFVSAIAVVSVIGAANAASVRQYVSLKASDVVFGTANVDVAHKDKDYDTKQFFGFGLGYGVKFMDFRAEIEGFYYPNAKLKSNSDVKFDNIAVFLNGYYDLRTNSPFVPYLGLGVGYDRLNVKIDGDSDTNGTIGFRAGIGVMAEISRTFGVDIGYRYNYFGVHSFDDYDIRLGGHELFVGARVSF